MEPDTESAEHRVLVIDDDDNLRYLLQLIFEDAGYAVEAARDGELALAQLRAAPAQPCVILLDLNMPTMTGWEFRAEQQQDASIAQIPVIVMSADRSVEQDPPSLAAARYFRKPFHFPELLAAVAALCP